MKLNAAATFQQTHLKVLLSSAVLAVAALGFVGCGLGENENNAMEGFSISLTNDGKMTANGKDVSENNPKITYARQWNTTKTKHLSADATITIDRTAKSTQVGNEKNATTGNAVTSLGSGIDAAYMFGLTGSGTADKPYSFYLAGFRFDDNAKPMYFISYYTGVQSSYLNSDDGDFDADNSENTAYEYALTSWTNIPEGSYTLTDDALKVYIDLDAIYGADNTVVTNDNYSEAKKTGIDGYKVTLKASAESETGTEKIIKSDTLKAETYTSKTAPKLETFSIDQAYLGFYAMVKEGKTLVADLEFNNDTIVKSANANPTDDFGNSIDLNGEAIKNF